MFYWVAVVGVGSGTCAVYGNSLVRIHKHLTGPTLPRLFLLPISSLNINLAACFNRNLKMLPIVSTNYHNIGFLNVLSSMDFIKLDLIISHGLRIDVSWQSQTTTVFFFLCNIIIIIQLCYSVGCLISEIGENVINHITPPMPCSSCDDLLLLPKQKPPQRSGDIIHLKKKQSINGEKLS